MNNTNPESTSPHGSEGTPFTSTPLSELGSTNALTVRDYDKEVQDLKRENFNLKLRIYFLEEQNQPAASTNDYQPRTTYVNQLETEIEQLRRRLFSQSTQSDGPQPVYNFDYDDERRAFREELDKYRKENEVLRQSLQLHKGYADGREKSSVGQSIHTTTTSIDSGLEKTTSGMSSAFLSPSNLQTELNEYKERERKLQEQVYSLRRQLDSSLPQTSDFNHTLTELDQARRLIQQYEAQIQGYRQQQSKAERVLQRLQTEYEAQIARLVERQHEQVVDYEKYQQEQDRASPNVNMDEYQQAMDNRNRIIEQLEEAISEITTRLRTPFTLMLPSQSTAAGWQDERSRSLVQELNTQMQSHLETVDQLRAECVELRQSEKHLKNQIDGLTHLISVPGRNSELPPLPRPAPAKAYDSIEDAQQLDILQTAVVQITLQLRSDAENVSGLTNRVAQILRDRDEWQYKIDRLQDELNEKNIRIQQLERREREYESQSRQQFTVQIETLQRDIKSLQDQLRERDRLISETRTEKEQFQSQTRKDYEKFDSLHSQEKQNLQGQLRTAQEFRVDLEQQLDNERRRSEDLQRKYDKATSTSTQVEQMEREIQQQRRQIEAFNSQIRESESEFQNERRQLERERDFEKDKTSEVQNTLNTTNRRYTELQAEFDRIRGHSSDELETLRRENQTLKDTLRANESKMHDLIRRNEQVETQISVFENRLQDNEDSERRARNENAKLQREIQELTREYDNLTRSMNEITRKYELTKSDFSNTQNEKERIESDIQTITQENSQLRHEIDNLSVQIRIQIQSEYEDEYRQLTTRTEKEIENVDRDRQAIRLDLDQSNSERARMEDRLQAVEYNLKQANQTIEDYENDIKRLRQAVTDSQERSEQIEREISRAYTSELKTKTDRLQDLDNKYRTLEAQSVQYERTVGDLRQEKAKLAERNDQLQRDYEQYRHDQQKQSDDTARKNSTLYEERVRREVLVAIENKRELIHELENQLRDKDNQIKKLQYELTSYEPKDLRIDLEIQIEQLRQELDRQEHSIQSYTQAVREKEQQIGKLHDRLQESEHKTTQKVETLEAEIQKRERRLEQISNDTKYDISEFERRISELQEVVRDRERTVTDTNDKLRELERDFDHQQSELKDYRHKHENLTINLNVAVEENETYLEQIKALEKQLEATSKRITNPEQLLHLQTVIEDLRAQLRQREDSIQGLQHTIADCDKDLKEIHQTYHQLQSEHARMQLRYEQMDKQYRAELDSREQTVDSLRIKLAEKDHEPRPSVTGALVPTDPSWKREIQKRDDVIDELKRKLDQAYKSTTSTNQYARRVEIIQRPEPTQSDYPNREELLYQLEVAQQQNDDLVRQLAQKSPNITELHNQIVVIRKELARQKYVNQVLWRKLDALSDIYGSNTRAELAVELVNYQTELEALKTKPPGGNTIYVAATHTSSRTSPGLVDSSSTRQRRHSEEDSARRSLTIRNSTSSHEEVVRSDETRNLEELREIIRNQNQYIQQMQVRVRINTPDILSSATSERLTEENKKLNLVIDTYKAETTTLNSELDKLYKTIELDRARLQQYEMVIKQQQDYIEQFKASQSRQPSAKRSTTQSSVSHEQAINNIEDLIINLDIDIFPCNDQKRKATTNQRGNADDSARYQSLQQDYQRQINDKDEQIRQLTRQINDLRKAHENELNQYQLKYERTHTDLVSDLRVKQDDLRQAQLQIDLFKSTKLQLEQAQDQNQRLHNEIKILQNELVNKKELIAHYDKQIGLLEQQIASRGDGKGEMSVRAYEMSSLLEEMRHLRQDLERSINRQNELQIRLDENIRLSRAPREFTFSGRGVSYPDLRTIDASASVSTENYAFTSVTEEKRSRPLGSSTIELGTEQIGLDRLYAVGELEDHENLRRFIAEVKIQLKAIELKIQEKLRSKSTSSTADPSIEWLEHRLNSLHQCLTLLERTYQLIESYRTTHLPTKGTSDASQSRLADENKELRTSLSKCTQELQTVKQKYKDQSVHLGQAVTQLTKANHKKANTDDYLALLLRPTLDVLQKARTNMEHHLKESSHLHPTPTKSARSPRRRRPTRID